MTVLSNSLGTAGSEGLSLQDDIVMTEKQEPSALLYSLGEGSLSTGTTSKTMRGTCSAKDRAEDASGGDVYVHVEGKPELLTLDLRIGELQPASVPIWTHMLTVYAALL
jgi:hypothetical protein